MYNNYKIGIVIPAYNEDGLIINTLQSIPKYVDEVVVIDDNSNDNTLNDIIYCQKYDPRIISLPNSSNCGLGYNLIKGYKFFVESKSVDFVVIMAGDNQMDPDDMPQILDKQINENYDYVKGNRLFHANISSMPFYRYIGNSILTILTKFSCGYYFLMDPQCGYTSIKVDSLSRIPIDTMTKRYGYNADILTMLNIYNFRVADVEVKPVYGREKSKIKLFKYIFQTSLLLLKLFFYRMIFKYIIRDFHPLVLSIFFGLIMLFMFAIPLFFRIIILYNTSGFLPQTSLLLFAITFLSGFQSLLFGLNQDMDYNKKLY
jgi:glycosyltransferase involved in cell wall biosynthesis